MLNYLKSIKRRDPSARNLLQILFYPSVYAILFYKISHFFWIIKLKLIGELISLFSRFLTGIEIHPGAKIGKNLFIDHGYGVVIGETSIIGNNCTIYHGVTLGSKRYKVDKRHPTIKNNVIIGAHAQIIGNIIIGDNCIIGANSIITKNIEDNKIVIMNNIIV